MVFSLEKDKKWEKVFKSQFYIFSYEEASNQGLIKFFSKKVSDLIGNKKLVSQINLPSQNKIVNKKPCAEILFATYKFRKKYNLVDDRYYIDLDRARKKYSNCIRKLGNEFEYSEEAKIFFINKNKNLYSLLENKYNLKFNSGWEKYIDQRKYDELKDTKWKLENIVNKYNIDLSKLLLFWYFSFKLSIEFFIKFINTRLICSLSALIKILSEDLKLIFMESSLIFINFIVSFINL